MVRIDSNGPIPGLIGTFQLGADPRYYKGSKPRLGDLAYTHLAICGPGRPRQRTAHRSSVSGAFTPPSSASANSARS
jgi:hypothetical protein